MPRTLSLTALLLVGCATVSTPPVRLRPPAPPPPATALAAAEQFYAAGTPTGLREAVAAAQRAAPRSFIAHELAAQLAALEDRPLDRFEHLYQALLDAANPSAVLHLLWLDEVDWSTPQRRRALGLLEAMSSAHPDPEARALAAFMLAALSRADGDLDLQRRALTALGPPLPLAVVGAWDNDQGKAFDSALPPEQKVDLGARYDGALLPIGWRMEPPADPRGVLTLDEWMNPSQWAIAYATGAFVADRAGTVELRLRSSDPIKVWVDGALVFFSTQLETSRFDQLVLPVDVSAGTHRVLIKTAHRSGAWHLYARVTGAGVTVARPGAATDGTARVTRPLTLEEVLARRTRPLLSPAGESARLAFHRYEWARLLAGGVVAVQGADAYNRAHPEAALARTSLAQALWDNGERGRASDLLASLDQSFGAELPSLRAARGRFLLQQGLPQKARQLLEAATKHRPDRPRAQAELADVFERERWLEDRCRVLAGLAQRFADTPRWQLALGACHESLQQYGEARAQYEQTLQAQPAHADALRRLHDLSRLRGDDERALSSIRRLVEAYPEMIWPRLRLAETLRQLGRRDEARSVLEQAVSLAPDAADGHAALGALAYQAGDTAGAVEHWQAALARNPDDERLANRLDYLAPAATGPWMADVPDEQVLREAVSSRDQARPQPGADLATLLDHQVTLLRPDGSAVHVITLVRHALNQAGRDRLLRQPLGREGRARVLAAYAVDPQGRRVEPSSVRGREIRFRGLAVGSTTALQYRIDSPPVGYLSRHFTQVWWFQGAGEQHRLSQWVLWAPQGTRLHEQRIGDSSREEKVLGDQLRVAWTAREVPPLVAEPSMPSFSEVAAHVKVSTLPDWDAYLKWEEALLEDAFRDSPELDAVARKLGEGAGTAPEKVARIHTFLMEDIRYEQDYENHIAGVKPHPAPMTLERRYGDCKDKAVLFIALAKKLGVTAHYALVRTRDAGPVAEDVPMQQFNHAIVYVPAQSGLEHGRFLDPTADALDVDALRPDSPGTRSIVYDPFGRRHQWRDIPYQSAQVHSSHLHLTFSLGADGTVDGRLDLSATGNRGAQVRTLARNSERTEQVAQMLVSALVNGGARGEVRPGEVKDLRRPAQLGVTFRSSTAARREGKTLRMKLPSEWNPKSLFSLSERRWPLLLGTPWRNSLRNEISLPPGMRATKLPASVRIQRPCLKFERQVRAEAGKVISDQVVEATCERISPSDYAAYRQAADEMARALDDELVLGDGGPVRSSR